MGIKNIGFIGLGTMGSGMVLNLLKNNFKVFAHNRTKSKIKISDKNLKVVDSPKEACESSEIIITCVSNDKALDEVLHGKRGAFESPIESKILVDCGTTSIEFTERIKEECDKKNAKFLDAPITGSKVGAAAGTLLFMVGGDKKTIRKCIPAFNAMGRKVVYCGANTCGQRAKIALNLAQSILMQGYFEGIVLGAKNGVPIEKMIEIFENSGAQTKVGFAKTQKVMSRNFEPHFKLELMDKDIKLAMNEMKKLKIDLPLSKEVSKIFDKAMKKGWQNDDFACLAKLLEESSKVMIKESGKSKNL